MRIRTTIMTVGAVMLAASAPVQGQCSTYTADACQKTTDMFNFLTPQISTALAGGAATIGQGGVLGGFPHWALGIRASAVKGAFPKNSSVAFSTTGKTKSDFAVDDQLVPMATIDGSIGIYKGFPLGVTRVGGLDLVLTATYIPTPPEGGDVTVTLPGGSTKFGAGVRIGLLQESLLVPGIAITYVQRGLPTISMSGTSNVGTTAGSAPGTFAMNDLSLKTTGWRLSASKTFLVFGLQAGVGQDTYDNSVGLDVVVNAAAPVGRQEAKIDATSKMTRTNIYAGLSLNFFIGKLVAEVGQVSGGSVAALYNSFGGSSDAAASRGYLSVGLRTGF